MKILFDICHPAHVHFFRQPMDILRARGHEILITSRAKEMTLELLADHGVEHRVLSAQSDGSPLSLLRELLVRDWRLQAVVSRERPDVLAGIGGIFISHVSWLRRVPSIVFYDTENARLQNALTFPLASRVCVPECYEGWTPRRRTVRYSGYHELSYLHPAVFRPNRSIALENGLDPVRPTFLVRLVSWKANHDIGERGWSSDLLRRILSRLSEHGSVLVSSEAGLPDEFARFKYSGDPQAIHHVMAFCRGYVGESATMASECAVLGVPAIYAARVGRGYTNEQESRYDLVRNVRVVNAPGIDGGIDWMMKGDQTYWADARKRLLAETVNVAEFAADSIEAMGR